MLKYLGIILAVLLCSCSDSDIEQKPRTGQFVYSQESITISLRMGDETTGVTIYENGRYIYQDLNGSVAGSWPAYQYSFGQLALKGVYESTDIFSAQILSNDTGIALSASMMFRTNNDVLDANGDGILDVQPSANFQQTKNNFINR